MMVQRSPYTENLGLLMKDLESATTKLEAINSMPQIVSKQELNDLIVVLHHLNDTLDTSFWEDKKLVPEGMNEKIEKAFHEIQHFQRRHPDSNLSGKRNVDQAITSLSSALKEAVNTFDKNLRDLKKFKIGRRVEKSGESKQS